MQDHDKNKNAGAGRDRQAAKEQPNKDIQKENENVNAAFREASKDIQEDPDLSVNSPNDDLDEGESARLGEKTDLV